MNKQTEALKLALEALKMCRGVIRNNIENFVPIESPNPWFSQDVDHAITAIREALAEQPAHHAVDWEKLYLLEVKKKNALAAKYERDTGTQLTRIIPMAEQPAQEPVAYMNQNGVIHEAGYEWSGAANILTPLYTSPPAAPASQEEIQRLSALVRAQQITIEKLESQRQWVGLTDEEIGDFKSGYQSGRIGSFVGLLTAIEAKLREKNA